MAILPIIIYIYMYLFLVVPSILLMGSYSIEEFQQSNEANILTTTIKETGQMYQINYIVLFKFNTDNNSINLIDEMQLPLQNQSKYNLMFGGMHDKGIWYLNINTSNFQPGNYMLHSEVTNDMPLVLELGQFKKHADKLFYIPPK